LGVDRGLTLVTLDHRCDEFGCKLAGADARCGGELHDCLVGLLTGEERRIDEDAHAEARCGQRTPTPIGQVATAGDLGHSAEALTHVRLEIKAGVGL